MTSFPGALFRFAAAAALPLMVWLGAGCGSKGSDAAPAATTACRARITIFCRCVDGEGGWQTCAEDGSGFGLCGPCDGSNKDPGASGSGGSQPAGGCGDGVVDPGEQCDDGNTSNEDACLENCRKASCGDGYVQAGVEECDDGNAIETDSCSAQCKKNGATSEMCPGEAVQVTTEAKARSVKGDLSTALPNQGGLCGGEGRDLVYSFQAPADGNALAAVSTTESTLDLVLYARSGDCSGGTELKCANNGVAGQSELVQFPVTKGSVYYVFVDSKQADGAGAFELTLQIYPDKACEGEGAECDVAGGQGVCAKGRLVCQGKAGLACVSADPEPAEICGDGLDNNCDGKVDEKCPCTHDKCTKGLLLVPDCGDPCVQKICAQDDYCCTKEWDEQCIGEVASVCGSVLCAVTCAHSLCQAGDKLSPQCDAPSSCVEKICQTDGFCCAKQWDSTCVEKTKTVCQASCD
jgi:cysteine-rich repeat protein